MVDPSRFEPVEGLPDASDTETVNPNQTMPHTPETTPDAKASEVDTLRQQLTASDRKRRGLLLALFLKHEGDTRPILEMLFAEATPEALQKLETLLMEGGALCGRRLHPLANATS